MDEYQNDGFVIQDDKAADWALRKIKAQYAERDRLLELAHSEIAELQNKVAAIEEEYEAKTSFLRFKLMDYMERITVDALHESKTQVSYKLLNGSLVLRKPKVEYKRDDEKLIQALHRAGMFKYIKAKETVDWENLKKVVQAYEGGSLALTATGEILDGLEWEYSEPQLDVR